MLNSIKNANQIQDDEDVSDVNSDPTQALQKPDPSIATPPSITDALSKLDKQTSDARQKGLDNGASLQAQADATAVTPEQLLRNRALDTASQLGKILEVGQAGAMQSHDRKYDNPASQKVWDNLIAQRQAQTANQQALSASLAAKAKAARTQPLEDIQNQQAVTQGGLKELSERQGLKATETKQASGLAQGAVVKNVLQKRYPDAQIPGNLSVSEGKELNDVLAGDPDWTLSSAEKTGDGIFATKINKRTGQTQSIRLGSNPEEGKQTAKADSATNKERDGIVKDFNKDPDVKAANASIQQASNLRGLAQPGNSIANSLANIAAVRTEVSRVNSQELANTGLMGSIDKLQAWVSHKGDGTLSPDEVTQYNALADDISNRAKQVIDSKAKQHAAQKSKAYGGKYGQDELYGMLQPAGAPTASPAQQDSPQPVQNKTPAKTVTQGGHTYIWNEATKQYE